MTIVINGKRFNTENVLMTDSGSGSIGYYRPTNTKKEEEKPKQETQVSLPGWDVYKQVPFTQFRQDRDLHEKSALGAYQQYMNAVQRNASTMKDMGLGQIGGGLSEYMQESGYAAKQGLIGQAGAYEKQRQEELLAEFEKILNKQQTSKTGSGAGYIEMNVTGNNLLNDAGQGGQSVPTIQQQWEELNTDFLTNVSSIIWKDLGESEGYKENSFITSFDRMPTSQELATYIKNNPDKKEDVRQTGLQYLAQIVLAEEWSDSAKQNTINYYLDTYGFKQALTETDIANIPKGLKAMKENKANWSFTYFSGVPEKILNEPTFYANEETLSRIYQTGDSELNNKIGESLAKQLIDDIKSAETTKDIDGSLEMYNGGEYNWKKYISESKQKEIEELANSRKKKITDVATQQNKDLAGLVDTLQPQIGGEDFIGNVVDLAKSAKTLTNIKYDSRDKTAFKNRTIIDNDNWYTVQDKDTRKELTSFKRKNTGKITITLNNTPYNVKTTYYKTDNTAVTKIDAKVGQIVLAPNGGLYIRFNDGFREIINDGDGKRLYEQKDLFT